MAVDPAKLVPTRASDDPAILASWYFGADTLFGHYRKVLLAGCRESIRASIVAAGQRVTESRLDDLAHLHSAYLAFLAEHLEGRTLWLSVYQREGRMT